MVVQVNNDIDCLVGVKYWRFSTFQQVPFYVLVVFSFFGVGGIDITNV